MTNWKEQQDEIEKCLRNIPSEELKIFRSITHTLAAWAECESVIKNTQYPAIAPSWFYPYINSL